MATSFMFEQAFPADPATVLALMRDPAFVRAKAEATAGTDIEVEITEADSGTRVSSTRSLPAEVPSYAAPFVGDTLTITEVHAWRPGSDPATADVTVDFHAALAYRGTITLLADGDGTVARHQGQFKASVPFVGGKVERVAAEQTERYLGKETEVAATWLG
ncbi:MAG: DUF2505 family protein [Actinomycetales bacterium]|nr:DUF2505 family protein [Actinomycetales bacterium]